jgi:AbrB family looped-hinge helix DNA binding protein
MATTVTSKGQVTIPKPVRDYLGIKAGTPVEFTLADDGQVVVSTVGGRRPKSRFERARGRATIKMRTDEIMVLTRGDD